MEVRKHSKFSIAGAITEKTMRSVLRGPVTRVENFQNFAMINGNIIGDFLVDSDYENFCAARIEIYHDMIIYLQDVYPESFLAFLSNVGGFLGLTAIAAWILQTYNR